MLFSNAYGQTQTNPSNCNLSYTRNYLTLCEDGSDTSYFSWDQIFVKYDISHKFSCYPCYNLKQDASLIVSDFDGTPYNTKLDVGPCVYVETHWTSPSWFVNDLKWWAYSQISDRDFASSIDYLATDGWGSVCQP